MTTSVPRQLQSQLDAYVAEHEILAAKARSTDNPQPLFSEVREASHRHATELANLIDFPATAVSDTTIQLVHQHDYHRKYLLLSDFIAHALRKPNGYAGDKDLMLMTCERTNNRSDAYARLVNQVYLELPAAQAVRARIDALTELISKMSPGTNFLNLACGPAIEVQRNYTSIAEKNIEATLIDHDPNTINYIFATTPPPPTSVKLALGNALRFIKRDGRIATPRSWYQSKSKASDFSFPRNAFLPFKYLFSDLAREKYNLIYSAGLYDYIRQDAAAPMAGAAGLTAFLFDKLASDGRLLIGNYMIQNPKNPHLNSHRLMMELYSDWRLLYRSRNELIAFTSALPKGEFKYQLLNESLQPSNLDSAVIGFLEIRRV